MFNKVETYDLKRFVGKKTKKMTVEIDKLEAVENCLFEQNEDKSWVLKVNYVFENEAAFNNKVKRYVKQILNIIKKYEKKAEFVVQENEEVYRRVVYLKGLDCAHCAARIESLAKKQFNHEQLIVDFATTRFIIETKDEILAEGIVEEVTNVAHRVDPRIIVQDARVAKKEYGQEEKKKNKYCIRRKQLEELKSEDYIKKNLDYFKEISLYIIAGEKKLEELENEIKNQ